MGSLLTRQVELRSTATDVLSGKVGPVYIWLDFQLKHSERERGYDGVYLYEIYETDSQ